MTTPVWTPTHPEQSQLWRFLRFVEQTHHQRFANYSECHAWSVQYPALFWSSLCDFFHIRFDTPPEEILSPYQELLDARWFTGATLNFAEHLLSRNDAHPALISLTEQGTRHTLSYKELNDAVAKTAEGLRQAGVVAGDRVGAVMPNIAETVIAMLATTALGAIWSSCSPDFGADAIADRLGQLQPKVLFITDGHYYHGKPHDALSKIIALQALIPSLERIVVCPFLKKETVSLPDVIDWETFQQPATSLPFASFPFNHPVYILFSSGTTGKPKCLIHGAGGTLLQHIKELGLHTDISANDNLFFYTTCGWMMWNWMISTLALGATVTLYDGSPTYPTPYRLFEIIEQEKVSVFGTSARFIATLEKEQCRPNEQCSLTSLRSILSTGSPLLPGHYDFVYQHVAHNIPLNSISGGTDIISCFALGNPIEPVYRGELPCLGLGMNVDVVDDEGHSVRGTRGELVCRTPFPSMPVGFWNDPLETRYRQSYFSRFPKLWAHGDWAEQTPHGGLIIYGRSDTLLNPGGVRIGTAEIYRQLERIPEIIDSVVIGQHWQDDVRVVLFVQLRSPMILTEELKKTIRHTLKHHASPRHVPTKILQVQDIPKTLNGKTMEIAVRQMVEGEPVTSLSTLANPASLADYKSREELQR